MYNLGALLMPSRRHYTRALYVFQMSWHCAPLEYEGAISLSGKPMRGKPQSVSNQKGSSLCLQSDDCWSQSPICWPLVTFSNLLTSTNNRWLVYRTVIIARWYIYLSVMQWSQYLSIYQSLSIFQYHINVQHSHNSLQYHNVNISIFSLNLLPNISNPTFNLLIST